MNDTCAICLDDITNNNESTSPYNCNHIYHKKCIEYLLKSDLKKKYNCILCQSNVKYTYKYTNFVFNNMLEGIKTFDIDNYLKKWEKKSCLENNHKFIIETLGEWEFTSISNPIFNYKCMLFECKNCKISQIIK